MPEGSESIKGIVEAMLFTMHKNLGVGLAAPQVGMPLRLFVTDVPGDGPQCYINPVFKELEGEPEVGEEGCLSLPGQRIAVRRHPKATIEFTDILGRRQTQTATGFLARCWQHEMDHLDGVLIIDKEAT